MTTAPIAQARLIIPSSAEHLPGVRDLVEEMALQVGFHPQEVQRIVTAAFEAVVNAATHGSPLGPKNTVSMDVRIYDDRMEIEISDQGPGFEGLKPQEMPDVTSRRGRGIPLMMTLMDEVRFETAKGGKVLMVKHKRANSVG